MIVMIVLHEKEGAKGIVVKSPNTHVLFLLLQHRSKIIARVIFFLTERMGTHVDMKRYIPVQITFSCLKKAQCPILLTVYCLSGYDTCSAFFLDCSKVSFQSHDTEFIFES